MKTAAWLVVVVAAVVGTLAVLPVWAAPATRDELKRQREDIEAEHAKRAEACRQQFVVTPCLDKVRADMQQALSGVRDQESALDAAERQQKRQARERRLTDKADKADQAAAAAASATRSDPTVTPAKPAPAARTAKPRKAPMPEERGAQEQQRRAEYEARQREIKAHRDEVEKRNAERARRKVPQPLPPPASGAS